MKTAGSDEARDLLLLSLAAGSADAVGYLGLGQVFTSNMTGNVVLLGIALGQGHFASAERGLFVLAIFMSGLGLGAYLGRHLPGKQWPALAFRLIGLEKIILLLFAIGWIGFAGRDTFLATHGLLALLALAMGLQSAALFRLSTPGIGTTAITSTLAALTAGLVSLLFVIPSEDPQREVHRRRATFHLIVILLYGCGAVIAGLLILHHLQLAGCFPLLATLFVAGSAPKESSR